MSTDLQGGLQGQGLKIGIVVARFNGFVTSRLLEGARSALIQHGVLDDSMTVASVPGSFEIPLVAKKMAESARYDAVVCLGAVIRGETDHYEYIAGEAAKGISQAGLDAGVPVIFGVLTTDTVEQAIDRAGGRSFRLHLRPCSSCFHTLERLWHHRSLAPLTQRLLVSRCRRTFNKSGGGLRQAQSLH